MKSNSSKKEYELVENHNYGVKDGKYGKYFTTKEGDVIFEPYGQAVVPLRINKNINTGEIFYTLGVISVDGEIVAVTVPKCELFGKSVYKKLSGLGAQVSPKTHEALAYSIINQTAKLKCIFTHSHVGFFHYNEKLVFGAHELLGSTTQSQYDGSYLLKPKGEYSEWVEMFNTYVKGNTSLELAVTVGLLPTVKSFLNETLDLRLPSMLIHVHGSSSSGKTTMARLALSVGAYSDIGNNSFFSHWSNTENAILNLLNGNSGYLVVLDELSMNIADKTSFLYQFSSGKEKSRMNSSHNVSDSGVWSTGLLSTGEFDIFDITGKNKGLRARAISIGDALWTKDAKSAEAINKACSMTYGHLIARLAKLLLAYDKKDIKVKFDNIYNSFKVLANNNHKLFDRVAVIYTSLILSHHLLSELLGTQLNHNDLEMLLVDIHDKSVEDSNQNITDRIMDIIIADIVRQPALFPMYQHFKGSQKKPISRGLNGFIEAFYSSKDSKSKPEKVTLAISTKFFDELMKAERFENSKSVLKALKENGLLIGEKDRYATRRIVGSIRSNFYIINLTNYYEEEATDIGNLKLISKGKRSYRKSPTIDINGLLDDSLDGN